MSSTAQVLLRAAQDGSNAAILNHSSGLLRGNSGPNREVAIGEWPKVLRLYVYNILRKAIREARSMRRVQTAVTTISPRLGASMAAQIAYKMSLCTVTSYFYSIWRDILACTHCTCKFLAQ